MYNEEGESVWERSLDSLGKVKEGNHGACPFMYQGQYYDTEIELAYNRFRYYDPNDGRYISVDPIGLSSGEFGFYNYVGDPNGWLDIFGLGRLPRTNGSWSGEPGNSTWTSTDSSVGSVEFNNGYPDFSPISEGTYNFNNLDGTDGDFDKVYERVKKEKGLNSKNAARKWLKSKGLTPHHHQNGRTIQLIPTKVHGKVPHEGGASKLRKKKGTYRK